MLYNRCTGIYKFGNNTYPRRIRGRSNLGHIFREKKSASYGPGNRILWESLPDPITFMEIRDCHSYKSSYGTEWSKFWTRVYLQYLWKIFKNCNSQIIKPFTFWIVLYSNLNRTVIDVTHAAHLKTHVWKQICRSNLRSLWGSILAFAWKRLCAV